MINPKMDQDGSQSFSQGILDQSGPGRREASPTSRRCPWFIDITVILPRNREHHPPARLKTPSAVRLRNPRLPAGALAPFTLRQSPFIIRSDGLFLERGMADSSLLGPQCTTSPPAYGPRRADWLPYFLLGVEANHSG